jgi:hypothetical protein
LLQQAAENYRQSIVGHELIIIKYYLDEAITRSILGDVNKDQLSTLPPQRIHDMLVRAVAEANAHPESDPYSEDRGEYEGYIRRADARLKLLGQ